MIRERSYSTSSPARNHQKQCGTAVYIFRSPIIATSLVNFPGATSAEPVLVHSKMEESLAQVLCKLLEPMLRGVVDSIVDLI
jgi:hypothetical protein